MNEQDLKILEAKGIAPAQVEAQLSRFKIGFPELEIKDSATVGCGIMRLSEEEQKDILRIIRIFRNYRHKNN